MTAAEFLAALDALSPEELDSFQVLADEHDSEGILRIAALLVEFAALPTAEQDAVLASDEQSPIIVKTWLAYASDGYPLPRTRLGNNFSDEQIAQAALVCGVEIPAVDGG